MFDLQIIEPVGVKKHNEAPCALEWAYLVIKKSLPNEFGVSLVSQSGQPLTLPKELQFHPKLF